MNTRDQFEGNALLALDMLEGRVDGAIPSWLLNPMEHSLIDRLAGRPPGSYRRSPVLTYRDMQRRIGTCLLDQWIPENPLSMGAHGYEAGAARGATTGAEHLERDGIVIDSPEAVARHLEQVVFPAAEARQAQYAQAEEERIQRILAEETSVQRLLGPTILKSPYRAAFPCLRYGDYGYSPYFMAYALYPDLIERDFRLQADSAVRTNTTIARAIREGGLPPIIRLDHDMADNRGTLANIRSLDRLWFPHFARAIRPLLDAGIRLLWHCDGNLMLMVPRLIEAGVSGFQGFQYEHGMDYAAICRMRDRNGGPLTIWAGVSVTGALAYGTPDNVRRELKWLVDTAGPDVRLFLGASSSIAPGTPHENVLALVEGMAYYRRL